MAIVSFEVFYLGCLIPILPYWLATAELIVSRDYAEQYQGTRGPQQQELESWSQILL